jgi:hypothetical protein
MTGTTKKLNRRCIIREYDFNKIKYQLSLWYDNSNFTPLSLRGLEQELIFRRLKGQEFKRIVYGDPDKVIHVPNLWLCYMKDYLYNADYHKWNVTVDTEDDIGELWIQYRKNTPISRLGWAEYTYFYR